MILTLDNWISFNSSSRHCCHYYNSAAVPSDEAYTALNDLCIFLSGVQSNYGTNLRLARGSDFSEMQQLQRAAKSAAGKIGGKMGDKSKKAAGGKNKPQHKEGEWYFAHCNNPNCVEKTTDGKGKFGKSKLDKCPSPHQYNDLNRKTTKCGKGTSSWY